MSDPAYAVENIVKIADSLASESRRQHSLFDEPLGPDANCFSSRQLLHLLEEGTTEGEVQHLFECNACAASAGALRQMTSAGARDLVTSLFTASRESFETRGRAEDEDEDDRPLPAIFVTESHQFRVADLRSRRMTVRCSVLPVQQQIFGTILSSSLSLAGGLIARRGEVDDIVDLDEDGKANLFRLRFDRAHLSRRVRHFLSHHQRFIDTVWVRGRFQNEAATEFVGQARLEFVNG